MAEPLFDPDIDSIEDVLAIRAKAIALAKEGKTIIEWTSEETNSRHQFSLPIDQILRETKIFLKRADPDLYGRRIRRTQPEYRL